MNKNHSFRIYDAEGKTLAHVDVPYDPESDEMTNVLELVGEFHPTMVGYEYLGESGKEK